MSLQDRPHTPLQALDIPQLYENVKHLLQIFCTLPFTTCTAERAFSALKFLKTYLRNSMTDDQLTGLALTYIHREIDTDVDTVIDRFAMQPAKRSSTAAGNESAIPKRPRLQR
jgi:hAT family C-terminal dimerisation region